jgi:hypothetical protein
MLQEGSFKKHVHSTQKYLEVGLSNRQYNLGFPGLRKTFRPHFRIKGSIRLGSFGSPRVLYCGVLRVFSVHTKKPCCNIDSCQQSARRGLACSRVVDVARRSSFVQGSSHSWDRLPTKGQFGLCFQTRKILVNFSIISLADQHLPIRSSSPDFRDDFTRFPHF